MSSESSVPAHRATANLTVTGAPAASTLGWASWAVFEWARNPYVILITIYVFAPYFSTQVVGDPVRGQALLGDANKYAGLMIALLAPLAGAIADRSGRRKPWIACFVVLMVPAMAALWFAMPAGEGMGVVPTLICIVVIAMCFEFGAVFHNAMLPHVAPATKIGFISGLAISLGNLAGLLLMVSVLYLLALPGTVDWAWVPSEAYFGIDQSRFEDARIVGPLTAIWLLLFGLPLLLFTPDGAAGVGIRSAVREGLSEVRATLRELPHYRNIATYLMARMIYNDGLVGILIFGGVYAAGIFGWGTVHMLLFGILMSAAAALGGYLGGWLDDRLGSKRTILVAVGGTSLLLCTGVSITPTEILFVIPYDASTTAPLWSAPYFNTLPELLYFCNGLGFAMFVTVAFASSRTMMARISPPTMTTQFFGLYALSGTATAFLGPWMVGAMTAAFASQRVGYASLLILFVVGFIGMLFVREERATSHRDRP
ncbi:MAG: MFS transporter [Gammaproteobacteria bacterium]|nr:MFS transporter [Gammaproteobacteria bacterium]